MVDVWLVPLLFVDLLQLPVYYCCCCDGYGCLPFTLRIYIPLPPLWIVAAYAFVPPHIAWRSHICRLVVGLFPTTFHIYAHTFTTLLPLTFTLFPTHLPHGCDAATFGLLLPWTFNIYTHVLQHCTFDAPLHTLFARLPHPLPHTTCTLNHYLHYMPVPPRGLPPHTPVTLLPHCAIVVTLNGYTAITV